MLEKFLLIRDKIFIDFFIKLKIKLLKKNVLIKKGNFYQNTFFLGDGKIEINENFKIGYRNGGGFHGRISELQVRDKNGIIKIGKNLATNNGIYLCSIKRIEIGNDVLIGSNVTIMDHNAHGVSPLKRRTSPGTPREVIIGDNVWLGNFVQILPGTQIGKNSIVGAGAVVKGLFPENCIIEGNPAKITKYLK